MTLTKSHGRGEANVTDFLQVEKDEAKTVHIKVCSHQILGGFEFGAVSCLCVEDNKHGKITVKCEITCRHITKVDNL